MNITDEMAGFPVQNHVFLHPGHEAAERRSWAVIVLCAAMMVLEIGGGLAFGSIALVADGLHMSTHSGALLLAALAYRYARVHAHDPRFSFGTGKLGDLAGFTSAVVLALISLLIGYDAVTRLFLPVPIRFAEAIPIAGLGLVVNLASVWLLGHGHDHHDHDHHHDHGHGHGHGHDHDHGHHHHVGRDNNFRAAVVHVAADAAVSVLVIAGLVLARVFGWRFMDPLAGLIGAGVIAAWSYGLMRDTGAILLDMNLAGGMEQQVRRTIEQDGDRIADLHVWRVGPGHLAAIVSVRTAQPRDCAYYRRRLANFPTLSHVTIEVQQLP